MLRLDKLVYGKLSRAYADGHVWITTGNDILGESGNLPMLTSLSTSITYIWNIQTMDSNGDFVQTAVNYQP